MEDEKTKEAEPSEEKNEKEQKHSGTLDELGSHMEKFAIRTAESIRKVIDKALASRNTVLTIRVNDESNKKLNMLVDVGLFKSRSESAAFLIQEGIKAQASLFNRITDKLVKIEQIREELKGIVSDELVPREKEAKASPAKKAAAKKPAAKKTGAKSGTK